MKGVSMSRSRRLVAALLAIVATLSLSACGYDPATHSTKGVILISKDEGIAKLPANETLVLKKSQSCGKATCTYFWYFVTNGDGKLTVIDDQLFEDRVREFTITKHQQVEISTYWLTDPLIASLDADGSVIIDWPTGFWARWTYRSYDPPQ